MILLHILSQKKEGHLCVAILQHLQQLAGVLGRPVIDGDGHLVLAYGVHRLQEGFLAGGFAAVRLDGFFCGLAGFR
ncbi:hypothetical protein D3C72_2298940 [compost metagenome]